MDSYKGGGVGEVRRINVVYFLSRGGRTDHPHLFRVSHLNRAGVRLRDVKRWLSELRGKDMPDNFSWSYKRKNKDGYVWQDLMDDDLITPVSDSEYVLKVCDVRGTTPCADAPKEKPSSLDEKKQNEREEKTPCNQKQVEEVLQVTADSDESSLKPPPIDEESPGAGEGESGRRTIPFKIDLSQDLQEQKQQQQEVAKKAVTKAVVARAPTEEQAQGAPGSKKHPVGRARRMRVAQVLHNILTCSAADADDAALRPVLRQRSVAGDDWARTPVCPGINGCGLHMRRKATLRRGGKDKATRDGGKRDCGDAHKPASLPRCSQCGKEFKPQELHSHMQSCRGFRERMRSSASARISVDRSRNSTARPEHGRSKADYSSPEPPPSAFLLTGS